MNEPMVIEFVGRVVEGNDGLEAYFDIEGGIAALEAGCSLYASVDLQNAGLTDEDGSCEVFPITEAVTLIAEVTKLRTQLDRLKKRAWAVMQDALDGAQVHPCDEHSEDVKVKTLAQVYQDLYASLSQAVIGFDLGEPGGDRTVQWSVEEVKAFSGTSTKLAFNKIDDKSLRMKRLLDILPGAEPICSFCFQRGCNGECHGDDMMGGGD